MNIIQIPPKRRFAFQAARLAILLPLLVVIGCFLWLRHDLHRIKTPPVGSGGSASWLTVAEDNTDAKRGPTRDGQLSSFAGNLGAPGQQIQIISYHGKPGPLPNPVHGTVRNNTSSYLPNVVMCINEYDVNGGFMGIALAATSVIPPHSLWQYSIPINDNDVYYLVCTNLYATKKR